MIMYIEYKQYPQNVNILFTIKMLNPKLKTKAINKKKK